MAKKALGKGLKALIPEEGFVPSSPSDREGDESWVKDGAVGSLPVEKIMVNPFQPRKEFDEAALEDLKNSIIENGVIQPVTVIRADDGYQLVSGERRLRAVRQAGFKFIPAYIIEAAEDAAKLELALIENIQREDLNAIEVALALKSLVTNCDMTQDEVAQKVGKNRSTISNFLRLLKLPVEIQNSIIVREISQGHARALVNLPSQKQQLKVWEQVISRKLSVRQTEELVNSLFRQEQAMKENGSSGPSDEVARIESQLRERFATKVRIVQKKKGRGEIHIQYFSPDDLERILELMAHD
ncbi:ParB/RepB/Spo0J family partition protein [Prosthecochloris sp. N3]|uniref:ParB/RepB/Spo0J family partition protein n=1 Tax=Prosthecochloris ethylica TaxID=2743976 RepID=A0ABR9XP62_9CHLB|nr:ParB/RepB/Spo0J family partition protein [Prosthecochloris ethylica]MBF0585708.1 ParB/RepB/Spo0J family partition protein [Prosthecochloris ethylica]MBF0635618.1 ParB/RepB/Spo0J family partition protein [Prosthecochloris ethylica]NUK46917.1 ParB/RepB/Spo0J family partition protein [Prosthecochloris ethylica]